MHIGEMLDAKRIGFRQDALGAMIRIFAVGIFKIYGARSRNELDVDPHVAEFFDRSVVVCADSCDQTKSWLRQTSNAVRKVVSRSAVEVIGALWCDDFVVGNMPHAANLFHERTSWRNSSRSSARSKSPHCAVVTVREHCFSTPRICMHMWCASIITITPRGAKAVCTASRIW